MIDDCELLRRYAEESSEEAFTELVGRHLGLVYHAALRQCGGDSHRAQDVAQSVFSSLARKARDLSRRPVLAGWLHTSTRYAAAQAVRAEVRRQAREREAGVVIMPEDHVPDAAWNRLKPVIDAALHALGDRDREAVLLRYFEQYSYRDIAALMETTEDGARMRVERALAKLRSTLSGRGITSTTAALGLALEAHAAAAAPPAMTASVAGAALATAASAGAAAGTTFIMSLTKLQFATVAAVLAAGSIGLVWQHQENVRMGAELAQAHQAAAQADKLRAENARLSQQLASPGPGSTTGTHPSSAAATRSGSAPGPGGVALAPGMADVASLGNSGRATARAAPATLRSRPPPCCCRREKRRGSRTS